MPDSMIFRATAPLIPVPTLVKELAAAFPSANVEGGGHECAGSIKFLPAYFDDILGFIKGKMFEVRKMQISYEKFMQILKRL
jgi:RecJ-like exonuclease